MISKILEINDLGLFNRFRWDSTLEEFKKFNVFYGWNYSGKTTLSRVFSNFEASERHTDYPYCSARILTEDGSVYDCENWGFPKPVRVFNKEFIKKNLKWDSQIEPIFFIGEENIKLQEELSNLREKQAEGSKIISDLSQELQSIEKYIDDKITDKAREVKNTLSIPDYTRTKLIPFINQIGKNLQLLDDILLRSHIDNYRSTDKKPEIFPINLTVPDIEAIKAETETLLQKKVITKTIQKLKDDPILSAWVRQGKDIHIDKEVCEFCGNRLPDNLLKRLNDHFSDEYENHVQSLDRAIAEINTKIITFEFPDKARFYTELINDYNILNDEVQRQISNYNKDIEALIEALKKKKKNPFKAVELPSLKGKDNLSETIDATNDLIKKHNEKSETFEKRKNASLETLQKHFASELISESNYFDRKNEISKLEKQLEKRKAEVRDFELNCQHIEQKLSETVKGAEKVNHYLQSFFGRSDISIKVTDKDNFQLYRGKDVAKNLSEGEKTAISFAYFIAKLEEKGNDLTQSIVFVDDPVSSLDSNHLFSTYSFIVNKLKSSQQLFIATHNFEFLNLLKNWFNKKASYYLIERCESTGEFYARISNMPRILVKFRSEYHYLFSILYDFYNNPVSDHNKIYILPNLARRFLEAYFAFKIPISKKKLRGKIGIFIFDEIKRDKVYKFLAQFSHSDSLPRSLMFPDFGECKETISIIMDRVKEFDEEHFNYLVAEVSQHRSLDREL